MKKTIGTIVMVCGFLVAQNLFAQSVTGANTSSDKKAQIEKTGQSTPNGPQFVDNNGDDICDNRNGRGNRGRNFTDANNDGICDNKALRGTRGGGRNFKDVDNNGVCDNFTNGRNGRGFGRGNGKCDGTGRGFRNTNLQK